MVAKQKSEEHYLCSEINALIDGLYPSEKSVKMWQHINKCKKCKGKEKKIRTEIYREYDWD